MNGSEAMTPIADKSPTFKTAIDKFQNGPKKEDSLQVYKQSNPSPIAEHNDLLSKLGISHYANGCREKSRPQIIIDNQKESLFQF